MRRRLLGTILLVVVLAVSVLSLRLLWLAGAFRRVNPHFAGSCHLVRGPSARRTSRSIHGAASPTSRRPIAAPRLPVDRCRARSTPTT